MSKNPVEFEIGEVIMSTTMLFAYPVSQQHN